jgi:hypothetical protein
MGPHYVYEHWRPDLNLPYYIGKGTRGRAWDMQARNRYHKRVTAALQRLGLRPRVLIVATFATDQAALAHEVQRIAYWRRRGAPLTNQTAGGESGTRPRRRRRGPQRTPLVLLGIRPQGAPRPAQCQVSTNRSARAYASATQNIYRA